MHLEFFTTGVFIGYFILGRSPRHEATTEAENNNLDSAYNKIINRWRKRDKARGAVAGLSVRQVYTQVSRSVMASLSFSQIH